jgi:hypothetical protein
VRAGVIPAISAVLPMDGYAACRQQRLQHAYAHHTSSGCPGSRASPKTGLRRCLSTLQGEL